ncbi:putative reverse transcriptase domain-containing protein [Tanacetum coccineum]
MERVFLSSGGRGVKQNKGVTTVNAVVNIENTNDKTGNNDDYGSSKNVVTNSTNAIHNLESVDDHLTRNVVDTSLGATIGVHLMVNDVNTDNINLETPIELNKGDNVNSNANVEPTASALLLAFVFERLANSASGFFLGKRVAYPVVANYDGVDAILENGPWFIRNNPLILKKWDPDVNLLKEDVGNFHVWVKLHGVLMTVFSEDGLSDIVTKLGTLLMLESYTSDMCMHSWGRSSYARTLIELQAYIALKDTIVVAIPELVGEGFYMCTIHVEYEWKPPRFSSCKVFGHRLNEWSHEILSNVCEELEQILRQATESETKRDDDYDLYDDDLYESHDMYDYLQAICYDLEIMFCGQMKE